MSNEQKLIPAWTYLVCLAIIVLTLVLYIPPAWVCWAPAKPIPSLYLVAIPLILTGLILFLFFAGHKNHQYNMKELELEKKEELENERNKIHQQDAQERRSHDLKQQLNEIMLRLIDLIKEKGKIDSDILNRLINQIEAINNAISNNKEDEEAENEQ